MNRFSLRSYAVVFAFLCFITQANAQLKVLEGNEIDFGKVYQTGELVHESLTLKNIGSDTIRIRSVSTSCGCTAAALSDSLLVPGEETTIKVSFNPTGYVGDVTKYIYITNSYPKNQMLTVRMTGSVLYALQPTPSYFLFTNAKPGQPDSASVTLSNTSEETIKIKKVELPSDDLTYKIQKKTLKPGEFADLYLYLSPKAKMSIDGFVHVMTTSTLQPVLQIRVYAGLIGR